MKKAIDDFNKAYLKGNDMFYEYLAFSQFFQRAFINEDGYIIDTGNFETVNREMLSMVYERIKKHPILWRLFFMIA
jgi:predicted permease